MGVDSEAETDAEAEWEEGGMMVIVGSAEATSECVCDVEDGHML